MYTDVSLCLIQYGNDAFCSEALNVGFLLWDKHRGLLNLDIASRFDRISSAFGVSVSQVRVEVESFVAWVRSAASRANEGLDWCLLYQQGVVRLTAPIAFRVGDLACDIEALSRDVFMMTNSKRSKVSSASAEHFNALRQMIGVEGLRDRVIPRSRVVIRPGLTRSIIADFSFKTDQLNHVISRSLDGDEGHIIGQVGHVAAMGDLLASYPDAERRQRQLVCVFAFDDPEIRNAFEHDACDILIRNRVKPVTVDDIQGLVRDIETLAKPLSAA